ncbi:cation-transporting atpase 4 [Apiospora arundinis]|uniref:Cation-transporting atpase 4 n=1 Tax=Apiospora arundinis TaxID=335852 RepID=A0ABR2HKF2_9PEZI
MAPLPSIAPVGLAAATLAVTVVLGALSIITVTLRIYVRSSIKALALDDYLMTIGLLFFVACCTFTSMDVYSGLGHHDVAFTTGLSKDDSYFLTVHAAKWLVFFQITYAWSLPFIKSSICWALLRFTTARRYVYPLWAVMIFSVGITFVGFVAVMVNCTPFAASWDPSLRAPLGTGHCDSSGRISQISYVISAISVITDWACAIIPAFVIWGLRMSKSLKITLMFILALGALASISTIVRLPYLQFYNVPTDYYYNVCNIVIWSIVECGVGIIAGSLPSLRPLLKKIPMFGSKRSYAYRSGSNDTPNQIKMNNLGHAGGRSLATCHGGEDESKWERLDDNSSQQYIIMKNTQVDVEYGHSK